jgi:hypothetical protein
MKKWVRWLIKTVKNFEIKIVNIFGQKKIRVALFATLIFIYFSFYESAEI